MKTCTKCQKNKVLSEFNRDNKGKDRLSVWCRKCKNTQTAQCAAKIVKYIRSRKTPCVVCGEPDPIVIDFHHRDPSTKSFRLGKAHNKSRQRVKDEIAKCDCLCANCHRRLHYEENTQKN